MHSIFLAAFVVARTPAAMCSAAIVILLIGILAARTDFAAAHGLGKVIALSNLCFAMPLAVFGALHLAAPQGLREAVPAYMPWRMFWVYFVGCALVAASLSIATKIKVSWSALLFGLMMFVFVATIHFPNALASHYDRILWTIVFRESSFGGAAWVLAGAAMSEWHGRGKTTLMTIGRILVALAAIFFGVEHFLHALGLPGVPLPRLMSARIPGREVIDYITGAALVAGGICLLLNRKTRTAATWVGSWLLLLIVVIYGPVLIGGLANPSVPAQIEGVDYFFDTLLFTSEFLVLARAFRPKS